MNFSEKFEPPSGRIIHGAGQSPEQFKEYISAVKSHSPAVYMMYIRINEIKEKFNKKLKEMNSINSLLIPQIGLNLKPKGEEQKCEEIISGKYDSEIKSLIKSFKNLNKPAFLRVGYEFNNPSHRYPPEKFVEAWKYIVDFFKKEECNNVAFVWCACTAFDSKSQQISGIMKYYPGDKYVNWFGNDLFGANNFKDNLDTVTEEFANQAKIHKKPLMIGESSPARVGVDKGEESWNNWFKHYFKWIHSHPIVKAFCYINWDWGKDWKSPEWLNGRIQENEEVRKRYVKELSKSQYIHLQEAKSLISFQKETHQKP